MSNRGQQRYQQYRGREHWDDDASSSSAYEGRHTSPYRSDHGGGPSHPHSNNGYSSDPGSMGSSEDGPTYILEHLATFRVSPEAGLVYPSDGMRRLLHMEKTTGIWTQKMMLKLERKWIFILSHENGDVVEKFPMELIREPTAFTSEDPKELYNNIFIFVVAEDIKRKHDNPTEMHIFQCLRISAKDLVEDVKLYMSGKSLNASAIRGVRNEDPIPVPSDDPAPEPHHPTHLLSNGYRDFSDTEVRVPEMRGTRSERSSVSHNEETSSTSSEKYERDVAILNNCFDDIERFIARLQHTAAATRELERRRQSRKSKKKDIGDGLLSMRAKPPPEREFIDIFQKFKLSFNLLAKLRAHIRDPNAPELVHFLFTPLALIVDASRDSYFEASLPPKVISPLLTQEAIELLTNCLSSRENELWQSLGNSWVIPKEVWKYPVQLYRPVFYSGWAPEVTDDLRERRYPIFPDRTEAELRRSLREDFDYYDSNRNKEASPPASDFSRNTRYNNRVVPPPNHHNQSISREDRPRSMTPLSEYQQEQSSSLHVDSSFEKSQKKFLDELKNREAKIVQVIYPRTANNEKELTVARGEYLEVVDDSRKWWKAMNSRGVTAHVPHTIVTPYVFEDSTEIRRRLQTFNTKKEESKLQNAEKSGTGIPKPPPMPSSVASSGSSTLKGTLTKSGINSLQDFEENSSNYSQADLMNSELKEVLERLKRSRKDLEIVKTPNVFISQKSTPDDVKNWLQMKGFGERILKGFEGMNGSEILSLTKTQLEGLCGKSEGARLDSQLTIQRNICGYKTVRSSELRHVLEEQRKKVDFNLPSNRIKNNSSKKISKENKKVENAKKQAVEHKKMEEKDKKQARESIKCEREIGMSEIDTSKTEIDQNKCINVSKVSENSNKETVAQSNPKTNLETLELDKMPTEEHKNVGQMGQTGDVNVGQTGDINVGQKSQTGDVNISQMSQTGDENVGVSLSAEEDEISADFKFIHEYESDDSKTESLSDYVTKNDSPPDYDSNTLTNLIRKQKEKMFKNSNSAQ